MKRKLAAFGFALALAELAAAYLPTLALVLTSALFCLGAGAYFLRGLAKKQWRYLPVLLGIALGFCWHTAYRAVVVAPVQQYAGKSLTCTATVEPDVESGVVPGMVRGTLRIQTVGGKKVNFKVYCGAFPFSEAGDALSAKLTFRPLAQDSYQKNYYAKGIWLQAEYEGDYHFAGISRAPAFALYRLRLWLSRKLRTYLPPELGGVAAAMLLADKTALDDTVNAEFRAAGVSHLLAVSGLHLALLCGLLMGSGPEKLRRRFVRPLLIVQTVLVLLYMALVGFPVSVVRAGIVFLVAQVGYFFFLPPDALTSLGLCLVLLSLQNAYAPCDTGIQLSVSAVLGVLLAGAAEKWERTVWKLNLWETEKDEKPTLGEKARTIGFGLLCTVQTAALASLATLPVLIAHGMTVSGTSVLSNLLVTWALALILLLGMITILLSVVPVFLPFAHMAAFLLSLVLHYVCGVVAWCAALPWARLALPTTYTLFVFALLAGLGWLFWYQKKLLLYLPAAGICMAAAITLGVALSRNLVRVSLVGNNANPCAVVTQNGEAIVLFRGGAANRRAVDYYLSEQGLTAASAVIDLRQNPQPMEFSSPRVVTAEDNTGFCSELSLLRNVTAELYHTSDANLAVLNISGYHIGMMAGNIELSEPMQLDLFLAGGAYPENLQANTILYTSQKLKWLSKAQNSRLLFSYDTPTAILRPGRSIHFEEVTTHAVQ